MADENSNEDPDSPSELRKAAERGKEAVAERDALKREMAFIKAGVDTESKIGKMLMATYDGELDKEAIQAEAGDLPGALIVPGQNEDPADNADAHNEGEASDRERQIQQIREGIQGGEPPDTGDNQFVDAKSAAWDQAQEVLKSGGGRDQAWAAYMGNYLAEAANGNPNAIFDRDAWERKLQEAGE